MTIGRRLIRKRMAMLFLEYRDDRRMNLAITMAMETTMKNQRYYHNHSFYGSCGANAFYDYCKSTGPMIGTIETIRATRAAGTIGTEGTTGTKGTRES